MQRRMIKSKLCRKMRMKDSESGLTITIKKPVNRKMTQMAMILEILMRCPQLLQVNHLTLKINEKQKNRSKY